MKPPFLRFVEMEEGKVRKTRLFKVFSVHSLDFLGLIHWRSGWRCYVISYEKNIDMSIGCNKELTEFMEKLEQERRNVQAG